MTITHAGSHWLPTRGLLFISASPRKSQLTGTGIITLACAVFIGRLSSSAGVPTAKPTTGCDCLRSLIIVSARNVNTMNILQEARASCHVMFMDLLGGKSHDISI